MGVNIIENKKDEIQNLQPLMDFYLGKNESKKEEPKPTKDDESFELF